MTIKELFGHAIGVAKFPDFAKFYNWLTKQDHTFKGDVTFDGGVDLTNATVTGLTPSDTRPYKVYSALLSQSGTDAPTAVVLENTTDSEITFDYMDVGDYRILFSGENLVAQKTWLNINLNGELTDTSVARLVFGDNTAIKVFSYEDGVATDEVVANSSIEIRLYN